MFWSHLTWAELPDQLKQVAHSAILPVGATEQHGPHLPVYTDTCIAEGMVRRVVELLPSDLPVTFLPVQAVAAINARRVNVVIGDGAQGCQQDNHVEAGEFPGGDGNQGGQGGI